MAAERHTLRLTPSRRAEAHAWIDRAIQRGRESRAWTMELREAKRTDDQNAALHGLIGQIIKQRPIHNGIPMDMALWKASFMQALGEEIRFLPTLDGKSVFPIGLSTSALPVARFSELIEYILWWAANEGLTVKHFDGDQAVAA